jgi:transcription antitermination factor NusG
MSPLPWYVIHLRSNFERIASQTLEARGFTTFRPLYRTRRIWSDRVKEVEEPLFTGYTFCRLDPEFKLPVLTTPGVISIVGFGEGPTPIADAEILALQRMLNSGLGVSPWPFLQEGQRVLLQHGPLAGLEGIVVSLRNKHRLIVSVPLLQRSVSVEIDRAWVKPLAARTPTATPQPNASRTAGIVTAGRSAIPCI